MESLARCWDGGLGLECLPPDPVARRITQRVDAVGPAIPQPGVSARTTPRAISVHELWTCQRPACRGWAVLRTEELDGGRPRLEHMTHVVMTQYCPALPAHLRPPRAALSPDERPGEAAPAVEHRADAAGSAA